MPDQFDSTDPIAVSAARTISDLSGIVADLTEELASARAEIPYTREEAASQAKRITSLEQQIEHTKSRAFALLDPSAPVNGIAIPVKR